MSILFKLDTTTLRWDLGQYLGQQKRAPASCGELTGPDSLLLGDHSK